MRNSPRAAFKNPRLFGNWEKLETTPANVYLFKFNNRNTRKRCKICSKLTIKTPERRRWRRSVVFILNFEHISNLFLEGFFVEFEQVNIS